MTARARVTTYQVNVIGDDVQVTLVATLDDDELIEPTTPTREDRTMTAQTDADDFMATDMTGTELEQIALNGLCDGTCQGCRNNDGCYVDPGEVVRDARIYRVCDHGPHLVRSDRPGGGWWVGADDTSECPDSGRGHEVEGSPR